MTSRRKNQRWEELDKVNIPLSRLSKNYKAFNRSEGKSPKTISWYSDTLLTFERFLENTGCSTLLADIRCQ